MSKLHPQAAELLEAAGCTLSPRPDRAGYIATFRDTGEQVEGFDALDAARRAMAALRAHADDARNAESRGIGVEARIADAAARKYGGRLGLAEAASGGDPLASALFEAGIDWQGEP